MSTRAWSVVLVAAALLCQCAPQREMRASEHEHHPCDPASQRKIVHRKEGSAIIIEEHVMMMTCDDSTHPTQVTPFARIRVPSAPTACPIGEKALRSWDRGHGFDILLPSFVASLSRTELAQVRQAMLEFGAAVEATVVACPTAGRADWLFVDTEPRGDAPHLQFFVDDALVVAREHAGAAIISDAHGN